MVECLLQSLQPSFFLVLCTAAKAVLEALNCFRTVRAIPRRHSQWYGRCFCWKRSCYCNLRKKHVFADLCKDPRETPTSAASQRQIGPSDAAKLSLVVGDSKQRKTSRIRRAQPLSAWFWVLFPRRTPRPRQLRLDYITTNRCQEKTSHVLTSVWPLP